MHFRKYPHPANYRFQNGAAAVSVIGPGITAIESSGGSRNPELPAGFEPAQRGLFGRCGDSAMFAFARQSEDRFYGLGEKWTGFEHSDKIFKFWNTDVWADFHRSEFTELDPPPDPVYLSIPYLIVKRENRFTGFLLETIRPATVCTTTKNDIAGQLELDESEAEFWLSADSGEVRLLIFEGPDLPSLTRRFQTYVGTTPLPPVWALGYQQCRWGYESEADLHRLDQKMEEHRIPCDGLWLDIDFMDGYRVFTWNQGSFPDPKNTFADLRKKGRRVIPIIDPGVKRDPEFGVYQRGRERNAFCQNPEGLDYVGLVWPGESVFPDFSLANVRDWWRDEVADFAGIGIGGAWIDMNDPSTGPADNESMCFDHGRRPHADYHNAYALGMAEATRAGFEKAFPNERPFLLSRSGCLGSQKYSAIWTGDNVSNYTHLRACIATTLNLALSGIPFNAPDVGGFGGDTNAELLRDWFKCCFLFPLLRNHSILNSREQEPWAFDEETLHVVRRLIRLRYRLRPYLYQLFAEHKEMGEAILRPLFYDFEEGGRYDHCDDAFLVGPAILQAPFLDEKQRSRTVELPSGVAWFDVVSGDWIEGGESYSVDANLQVTPLFVRDQSLLPLARIGKAENGYDGAAIDFHVFVSSDSQFKARYQWDDGISTGSPRSKIEWTVSRNASQLEIHSHQTQNDCGKGDFRFTVPPEINQVLCDGKRLQQVPLEEERFVPDSWRSFA